jgi:predicted phosphohydrolase
MNRLKIRYFSDLHLEFLKPKDIEQFLHRIPRGEPGEVCVVAGDIGHPFDPHYDIFLNHIHGLFEKSFFIAGNHEFYRSKKTSMEDILLQISTLANKYPNVTFLNNSIEVYNGFTFIGTTLWSYITNPDIQINDTRKIKGMTFQKYNRLHNVCVEFLNEAMEKYSNCVLISHHVPTRALIHGKYKNSLEIEWFAARMYGFIQKNQEKIVCWFYGHTHESNFESIEDVPFRCNPIGYPHENSTLSFDSHLTIVPKCKI